MVEEYAEKSLTEWNLSAYKINLVGQLLTAASMDYLQGKLIRWLQKWNVIEQIISNRIEEEDKKELKKYYTSAFKKGAGKKMKKGIFVYWGKKYTEKVNEILKEVGMDIKERDLEQGLF